MVLCTSTLASQSQSSSHMVHSSLVAAASAVLGESDAFRKKAMTDRIVSDWNGGSLVACRSGGSDPSAPEQPSRDDRVTIVAPRDMPKLGKGGTLQSRQVCMSLVARCPLMC